MANVKYLLGLFIAVALITGFALENKLTATTQVPVKEKEIKVEIKGNSLKFIGDKKDIREVYRIISKMDNKVLFKISNKENGLSEVTFNAKKSQKKEIEIIKDENDVFTRVEEMPQFPGGTKALLKYISQNVKYPKEAADKKIQGRVFVKFVIEKDGSIGEVKPLRSPDPLLTEEAIRVVKTLPKFTPGKQRGKPIRVWYQVPLTFRLTSPKEEKEATEFDVKLRNK